MDQFTRRSSDLAFTDPMYQRAIQGESLPKYLSTGNDPLYRFHQWRANLRVLEVVEIKTEVNPWSANTKLRGLSPLDAKALSARRHAGLAGQSGPRSPPRRPPRRGLFDGLFDHAAEFWRGGASCFRLMVVVASGERKLPVTCCALALMGNKQMASPHKASPVFIILSSSRLLTDTRVSGLESDEQGECLRGLDRDLDSAAL